MTDTTFSDRNLEIRLGIKENSILIQETDFVYQINWFNNDDTLLARVMLTEDYLSVIEAPTKLNGDMRPDEQVTFTKIIIDFAKSHKLNYLYWMAENRVQEL
ncbi:MAG TPA: hypothetical protein PLV59_03470 [Candidatus Dojkabacteria bacterium]|nr:hypothetical protein [Candidatus Dojkabacteria bacterium]